jgi:hypothetical protein
VIFYTPVSRHSLAHDPENATEYDPDPIAFSSHALLQLCLLLLKYHRACILTSDSSKPITDDKRISQHLSNFPPESTEDSLPARRGQRCHRISLIGLEIREEFCWCRRVGSLAARPALRRCFRTFPAGTMRLVLRLTGLAWKIHDFRNTEGLAMVQIRCLGGFETKNEAFA